MLDAGDSRNMLLVRVPPLPCVLFGLTVLATFGHPRTARADDPALAAFNEGRRLAKEDRCGEAIPKFLESLRYERTVGALLNLGDCYERSGKLASASRAFREAAGLVAPSDPRRLEASTRIEALAPHVPTLAVTLRSDVVASVSVERDGSDLPRDAWNTPLSIDPGEHVVTAHDGARIVFTRRVSLAPGDHVTVAVDVPASADVPGRGSPPPTERSGTLRTLGWIAGGAGLAAVAAGGAIGYVALGKHDDLTSLCPRYPTCATASRSEASALDHDGRTDAALSTAAFVVGGALLVTGAVLLLTSPSRASRPATAWWLGQGTF